MTNEEIRKIEERINELPQGGITYKTISGKSYAYYQWRENGKQRARRIKDDELAEYSKLIEERKELQKLINVKPGSGRGRRAKAEGAAAAAAGRQKETKAAPAAGNSQTTEAAGNAQATGSAGNAKATGTAGTVPQSAAAAPAGQPNAAAAPSVQDDYVYKNLVWVKGSLLRFAAQIKKMPKRACYETLDRYLRSEFDDRILILYGLRRTGKTVMIRQAVLDMDEEMRSKAAFIQPGIESSFEDLIDDLKHLEKAGYRYLFLDEITAVKGFMEKAAVIADIFAASGIKIVLSGADTLCFSFAANEQLYDRCVFLHTTFLPYREYAAVTGTDRLDDYIRYGGTMVVNAQSTSRNIPFHSGQSTDQYINSAIVKNIVQTFHTTKSISGYRGLRELEEKGTLEEFIRNEIADMNHVFAMVVITRVFLVEPTYVRPGNKPAWNKPEPDPLMRHVVKNLRDLYDHKASKKKDPINIYMYREDVRKCLRLIDVIRDIDVVDSENFNKKIARTVFTQPGLRYSQAKTLLSEMLEDDRFRDLTLAERESVMGRLMGAIREQMIKDSLLLETAMAKPGQQVFVLRFPEGDIDMVAADKASRSCEIFSFAFEPEAPEDLPICDEEKCALCEKRYGYIKEKHVVSAGDVRRYLKNLGLEEERDEDDDFITFLDV